jgi:hypothetical protein
MTSLPNPVPDTLPSVQTRLQLDALLQNIVDLQRTRDELRRNQEEELALVRQKFRGPLAELDHFLLVETGWAESWAQNHRMELGPELSLRCEAATIGFECGPPRVERASRRWTWPRIAQTLAGLAWGARYLRTPAPEVDRDAVERDLSTLSTTDLRDAGMKVVPSERFVIKAHDLPGAASTTDWQQAA